MMVLIYLIFTAAPTADKGDFRHEFDFLLVQQVEEKFKEIEGFLVRLTYQVEELEKNKDEKTKGELLRELTVSIDYLEGAADYFKHQAARTDLDVVEKFNFDAIVTSGGLLHDKLKQLLEKVKNIDTN